VTAHVNRYEVPIQKALVTVMERAAVILKRALITIVASSAIVSEITASVVRIANS